MLNFLLRRPRILKLLKPAQCHIKNSMRSDARAAIVIVDIWQHCWPCKDVIGSNCDQLVLPDRKQTTHLSEAYYENCH